MADKAKNSETPNLSDTEDRLILDTGGQLREQLLKDLIDEAFRLKNKQGKGVSPEEFEQNDAMITAILAAAEVVDQTWAKHHSKKQGG